MNNFFLYLITMAGVTYLVRMLPLVLVKRTIKNRFLISFLHYVPFSVLTVMTVPAIFYATSFVPALAGFVTGLVLAFFEKPLVVVAALSSLMVFVTEYIVRLI